MRLRLFTQTFDFRGSCLCYKLQVCLIRTPKQLATIKLSKGSLVYGRALVVSKGSVTSIIIKVIIVLYQV